MHRRIDCKRFHELNIKVEVRRTASDIDFMILYIKDNLSKFVH